MTATNVKEGTMPFVRVGTENADFRADLPKIDVPTLVVHGTADRILPFAATAARLRDENLIADLTVVEVKNGPHNIGWTHPEEPTPRCSRSSAAMPKQTTGSPQPRL
jgi:pimeloyl-ACP methyl ester carboxylesterase